MAKMIPVANDDSRAYFVGGGIGSLAGAVFLIRDAKMPGENIHILEELPVNGGSCDGTGNPDKGYMIRGGRMINDESYVCTYAMLESIPSIHDPKMTVLDEIHKFNVENKTHASARLVDKYGRILDVSGMGFDNADRLAIMKLMVASEAQLGTARINQFFGPHFFTTTFWFMWATTFAFQPWHSLVEFKRYFHRFTHEFSRIETLAGVRRTVFNQYDSIILPMQTWLAHQGVNFNFRSKVTDLDFNTVDGKMTVCAIRVEQEGSETVINVRDNDLVFVTNGTMTESSTLGTLKSAPAMGSKRDGGCWTLWERLAAKSPEFGNPAPFCDYPEQSLWESFTVTLKNKKFLRKYVDFSSNIPGSGALMTFKDSNWLMSIVVPKQPHFINQPEDVEVFWGYALFPDKVGDYVKKKMRDCSGEEIFTELCYHLGWLDDLPEFLASTICLPCMMPYITSQFMPRAIGDRPLVNPKCSHNLAFIGQFVEVPDEIVFTLEMSVRSAQYAVYNFYNLHDKKVIPPIYKGENDVRALLAAAAKMMS